MAIQTGVLIEAKAKLEAAEKEFAKVEDEIYNRKVKERKEVRSQYHKIRAKADERVAEAKLDAQSQITKIEEDAAIDLKAARTKLEEAENEFQKIKGSTMLELKDAGIIEIMDESDQDRPIIRRRITDSDIYDLRTWTSPIWITPRGFAEIVRPPNYPPYRITCGTSSNTYSG